MGITAAGVAAAASLASAGAGIGATIANGGGSQPTGTTTTSNSFQPWSLAQGPISDSLNVAKQLYNGAQPAYYPGSTVAGFNDYQNSALGGLFNTGSNGTPSYQQANSGLSALLGGQYLNPVSGALLNGQGTLSNMTSGGLLQGNDTNAYGNAQPLLSNLGGGTLLGGGGGAQGQASTNGALNNILGQGLDPRSNPYLQQAAANTTAQTLAPIEAQFAGSGRLDSGLASSAEAQGLGNALGSLNYGQYNTNVTNATNAANASTSALGTALQGTLGASGQLGSEYSTNLASTLGAQNVASSNYTNQTNNLLKGYGIAPTYDAQSLSGLSAALGAGTTAQQQSQAQLADQVARFNYQQQLPFTQLQTYEQFVNGSGALGFKNDTQTIPYYQNPTTNLVGGISGSLGIGNSIYSALTGTGTTNSSGGLANGLSSIYNSIFGTPSNSQSPAALQQTLGLASNQYVP